MCQCRRVWSVLPLALFWLSTDVGSLHAMDYFLTIAGGYAPSGNQASLEANVVFYQQVLDQQHRGPRQHEIYFADGADPAADLQVLATKSPRTDQPATDLLAALHRRRGQERVEYRNHQVPQVSGPLDPVLIRTSIEHVAKNARKGDRLIIYVTAHGSPGKDDDEFNTTMDCWNEKKVTAREFSRWLKEIPADVPTLMVMAQCYCGGFSRTIFEDLEESKGFATAIRAGFFAQQYNLPAAGCRPDIQNDEEFSSYFWGAISGRSRKGTPIDHADIDGDGSVSFAEAYAHAVTAGETIDIPLRTSDVVLRAYSKLPEADANPSSDKAGPNAAAELSMMSGNLQSFVDRGRPVPARIITELSHQLGFNLHDDVTAVNTAYEQHLDRAPSGNRNRQGRRGGSGRRDLLREIGEKWAELADERRWERSPLLRSENQETLAAEIKQLPAWPAFEQRRRDTEVAGDQSERHELREIKFRRLIKALELVVLEKNLPLVATPDVVERFRQIIAVEESTLSPKAAR